MDNAPQLFVVCAIPKDRETREAFTKEQVIVKYNRWLDHRCRCDRLNHPQCRFGLGMAVDLDLKALESLTNDNRYIIRFRTKAHSKLNTKLYGQLNILFNSTLKVYAKYNIFREMKL